MADRRPGRSSSHATVGAGGRYTCILHSGGTVECWGANSDGQLGNGTKSDSSTPVTVNGITNATAISAAGSGGVVAGAHTCVLLSGGTVECWGDNSWGQLGNGTKSNSATPVAVSGITNARAVSVGWNHTCALLSNGTVKCWGSNSSGQLGNGTKSDSATPVAVSGITNASAVSAGWNYTCVLLSSGTVECWGDNYGGDLGNGTTTDSLTPVQVSGITSATAISTSDAHTCALLSSGMVECWGRNSDGELGNGTTTTIPPYGITTPVQVSGITNATAIGTGGAMEGEHTCALLSDGTVECWGYNAWGQLGNGTTDSSSSPVQVSGITNVRAIGVGSRHTCALLSDGTVECWGDNSSGQLGNGTTVKSTTPVSVVGHG